MKKDVKGRRGLTVLTGIATVAVLTFLFFKARPVDFVLYSRFDERIHLLKGIESELSNDIRETRYDVQPARSSLIKLHRRLEETWRELAAMPELIGEGQGTPVAEALRSYEDALWEQEKLLRQFNESNDGLKTGRIELPETLTCFTEHAPEVLLDPELSVLINSLAREIQAFTSAPDAVSSENIVEDLDRLKRRRLEYAGSTRYLMADLLARLQDLIVLKHETDGYLEQLAKVRLSELSDRIFDTYRDAYERQVLATDLYRLYMYLFAIVFLGKIAHAMWMLKRSAMKLNEVNETLEEKVAGRTRLLSKANAELGTEVAVRKLAELEAQEARKASDWALRTKSDFLANMSHEIRPPMTAILGFSERLLDPTVEGEDRTSAINTIRRNGEYLLQLINDILDLSKIEAGKLSVENIPCSPFQILSEIHSMMSVRAERKNLMLDIRFEGYIPKIIETDPVRLRQVLINLIGNAIKFTERGGVHVVASFLAEGTQGAKGLPDEHDLNGNYIQFKVSDTGIGLREEQLQTLFEPFTQADSSTTRKFGGTGLGLSISKHLVELLGGNIEVESTADVGSNFTFCIETGDVSGIEMIMGSDGMFTAKQNTAKIQTSDDAIDLDCRILLVEDGQDNQRLMQYVLKKVGAEVEIAENGLEGVKKALAAWRSDEPYDVILMDMQMPILDGYEATRRLRQENYERPIIALTAHAMSTDRQKCLDAGCDEFATKPIDRRSLIDTIAGFLDREPAENERPDPMEIHDYTNNTQGDGPIVSEFADDADMLELIEMFVEELASDIATMRTAISESDMETLATVAHQLKGSAGGYGFPILTEYAGRVEKGAREGGDPDGLAETVETFAKLCSRARASA